jgi:hypothetical protein
VAISSSTEFVKRSAHLTALTALVATAVATVGYPSSAGWFGFSPFSRVVDATFRLGSGTRLEVRTSSFDLTLVPDSDSALRVHGTVRGWSRRGLDGVTVTRRASDGRTIVSIDKPAGAFTHIVGGRFTLHVPRVSALDVVSSSGNVSVSNPSAPLGIRAQSGGVLVDRARVPVTVMTSSGNVVVNGATAALCAQTRSGDVRARDIGASLSLTSSSGDQRVTIAPTWSGTSLALQSTSGNIDVSVPRGFRGVLHATTRSGDVRNVARLPTTLTGAPSLDVATTSGDITIH